MSSVWSPLRNFSANQTLKQLSYERLSSLHSWPKLFILSLLHLPRTKIWIVDVVEGRLGGVFAGENGVGAGKKMVKTGFLG